MSDATNRTTNETLNETIVDRCATDKHVDESRDMNQAPQALSADERQELEALRAEKEARKIAEERRELEILRAEKAKSMSSSEKRTMSADVEHSAALRARATRQTTSDASNSQTRAKDARLTQARAKDAHIAEIRAKNAKLMEPDEDLRMPLAQKIVLLCLFALVVGIVLVIQFGGKH